MVLSRVHRRWIPGLALLALAAAHGPLEAQRIVGRVLEEGGGGPVAGAMVRLVNDTGLTGSGWLTAADGRFRLEAPAGGTYEIRVERIGFATVDIGGITVADNGIASVDVTVETEPITLEGLQVEAQSGRCRMDERGGATQVVWDEARKALAAATWTEAQVNLRFVVSVWDRQISPRTSQILFEELEQRETLGANSVQSLPPEELVRDGYVQSHPGFVFYYAPDATVLLSDEFLPLRAGALWGRGTVTRRALLVQRLPSSLPLDARAVVRQRIGFPATYTCSSVCVLVMSFIGEDASTMKSAHFPTSSVPTSSRPRHAAALLVAASRACSGRRPALTMSDNSRCSKKPGKRPAGPASVPNVTGAPASTRSFRFRSACLSATRYPAAAGLCLMRSMKAGSLSLATSRSSANSVKKSLSKKSGRSAYTKVLISRVSVGT